MATPNLMLSVSEYRHQSHELPVVPTDKRPIHSVNLRIEVRRNCGNRAAGTTATISAGSYITMDCKLGYDFGRFQISLNGSNLTNRRDPVLQSELGEGQFYLFPARRLFVKLSALL